jgi:hypothetical protein
MFQIHLFDVSSNDTVYLQTLALFHTTGAEYVFKSQWSSFSQIEAAYKFLHLILKLEYPNYTGYLSVFVSGFLG